MTSAPASASDIPTEAKVHAERAYKTRIAQTVAALAKEPKVKVRVQEDTPVTINGHRILIAGKTTVDVPRSVAQLLEDAKRI